MTLREYLNANHPDTVYIGSMTAYMYIGSADEEKIKEESFDVYMKYRNFYRDASKQLKTMIDKGDVLTRFSIYKELVRRIHKYSKYFASYKPFLDREVKEAYQLDAQNPRGLAIIIEGSEAGDYWFMEEYESRSVIKNSVTTTIPTFHDKVMEFDRSYRDMVIRPTTYYTERMEFDRYEV